MPAKSRTARRVYVEGLETRLLMRRSETEQELMHGVTCTCCQPVKMTAAIQLEQAGQLHGPQMSFALGTVPALSSRPGAAANIYLDFDGAEAMTWGTFNATATPAYSIDGNTASFTGAELANIQEIWSRVAEMYSPFDINVTTVDPGNLNDQETVQIIIGGDGSWYDTAGGVAYIGGFYNTASNIGWVFPAMLGNGHPKYVADATAHEAGHTFGLRHQSKYSGSKKTLEYNPGTSAKAPIMGNSYAATRPLWWNGQTTTYTTYQNDLTVLANSSNGFGYRGDDHGGTIATASAVDVTDDAVTASGVIESISDKDYFSFSTMTGTVSFTVSPAQYGGMLDATLTLLSSAGATIATVNTTSMGETLTRSVSAGQYYLVVGSKGAFGDIGQFTLSGTIVTSPNYVAPPAGVTATASNGNVLVRWTDMSWNEQGFTIERSGNGGSSWLEAGTAAANATSYTDTGATVGTAYLYRVIANGENEDSDPSGTASVSVTPAAPTGLTAAASSASQINLSWTDVTGETGYRVLRSPNGTTWSTLANLAADVDEYSSTGLSGGTRYYYRVMALSSVGNSAASTTAYATTLPVAPTTVNGTPSATSVSLSWTNVVGETGYKIQRSTNGADWTQIATTNVNVVTYSNTGLDPNTTYYYRVIATNAGGDSSPSSAISRTTLLAAPTGASASVAGTAQINLSWNDSTGETGYRVERLSGTTWAQVGANLAADTTSLNITGLTPGTSYTYRVRAINAGGLSLGSNMVSATTIPPAPATLTATAQSVSQIRLTWTNVAGETGYKIERSADGNDWTQIATTAANVVAYSNSGLDTDTLYYYRVKPYNTSGDGAATNAASTRTLLAAPTGLTATTFSNTRIDLEWDDSDGETGYRIERLAGTTWVQVGTNLAAGTTEYSVTPLSAGTAYSFRVRAINAGGLSLGSAIAAATTIPAAPTTLNATVASATQITLSWTNVAGETGYKIERSPDGSNWTQIATTAANVVSYANTGLSANTAYYYRVRATNASGDGAYSATVNRTTFVAPPTGLAATPVAANQINLSWNDSTGETGYRVERLAGTTWVQVGANLAAGVTSFNVTGLAGGTSYRFRVRAINAGGIGAGSDIVTAVTMPGAPAVLNATVQTGGSVRLGWTNVAGETGYRLERSTDGIDFTQIATTGVNVVAYIDSGLSSGTYYYRVLAYNASGNSSYGPTITRVV